MASIKFKNVYLGETATISGKNEKINTKFSIYDYFNGEETTENAEMKMQKIVINDIKKKNNIDLLIGSDLSNQIGISSKVMSEYQIPFLGVYSACASYVEEIIIAASILNNAKDIYRVLAVVSSHNLSVERTFRYPIEYGSPRRITQSFTATGAVASLITKDVGNVKIESCTIGKVIDYGIKDVNNMGAIMAPSAASTLMDHLKQLNRKASYYDLVMTGDLGKMGSELFLEILSRNDIILKDYIDAGSELIVDRELTNQGASGPVCLPLVLHDKILSSKKYKKILIIGTGSLHNLTLVNQKNTLPGVSHAVSLEVVN